MSNIFVLIKHKDQKIPNYNLLKKVYKEYNYSLSFFSLSKQKIYVNENYACFDDFTDDLYKQAKQEQTLIIVLSKDDGNHISNRKNLSFYNTTKSIFISNESISFLDFMADFDYENNKSLFQMFANKNWGLIINPKQFQFYGIKPFQQFGYLLSQQIQIEFKTNNIKPNFCYLCNEEDEVYLINKSIFVCKNCFNKLKCFQCKTCKCYFSNKYRYCMDLCIQCRYNTKLDKNCYLLDSWIGMQYLKKTLNAENIEKRAILQLLKSKSQEQISKLRIDSFNSIKQDSSLLNQQLTNIYKNLQRKVNV